MKDLGPWFGELAGVLNRPLPAVPAQALQWGGPAQITGVDSKVGAPKIEFFLDFAAKLAQKENIPFEEAVARTFGVDGRTTFKVRQ